MIKPDILLEVWRAPDDIRTASKSLTLPMIGTQLGEITMSGGGVVSCNSALPHVDAGFPEITALLVLRAAGHRFFASGSQARGTRDTTRRTNRYRAMVPAEGDLIVFNAHCIHWLDPGAGPFHAFAVDFALPPTRDVVEAAMRRELERKT